jgi:glycosyltransferase involved in cell wall biosynthesis
VIRLSAVIIACDEERSIGRCLDSLAGVADEIVVVDSGSTDRTVELCRARGARVLSRPFDGFTTQKNFALDQASHDQVLSLDADEALSPGLAASIRAAKADWRADGYAFNRLNHYGRKPIRTCGWYPDAKIRLWDRRRGRWAGGLVHETVVLQPGARQAHLQGDLLHFAYQRAGQLLAKMQRYSDLWARQKAGRRHVGTLGIAAKAAAAFFKAWVQKGGWRDGYEGFVISASLANGVLYNNAKLLEASRPGRISLVVTTYNRKDALELVLRSVLGQEELPDEVIVADDGSREDTRALVERLAAGFPVPLRHCWHEDQGFRLAAIRNRAVALTACDYVVMVDGDLVLHPAFLRDHRRAARRGRWVQGGRVMLSEAVTAAALATGRVAFGPLEPGTRNRKNAVRSAWLSRLASHRSADIYRVRGANLAFWRDDVVTVNGFNEGFVGWGREDSEFAARLHHAGVERLHLKFAAVGYHLWHPEAPRTTLEQNQRLLDETVASRATRCAAGIDQYLARA